MAVPPHVRALREDILARQNGRIDDVEFTFRPGRWNHLGEATLMNRIKSHQGELVLSHILPQTRRSECVLKPELISTFLDVGQKWYPDLLERIREQAQEAESKQLTVTQIDG